MSPTPCHGMTDLFYSHVVRDVDEAKALCHACPHRAACLQRALDYDEPEGVFGGFTHIERKFFVMEHGATVREPVPALSVKLYSSRTPEVV